MEVSISGAVSVLPRIGDKAPDFEALTTIGTIKFSEYAKNSWVILFSHPADFTPVCTTELVEFAKEIDFFNKHNTKLIGLSVDSIHSHIAWVQNIKEKLGVTLSYPLVADISMNVARLYGMLHPGESQTATVRAVFFIDPHMTIRLVLYYPLNVGRSMEEIKRVLISLQTADNYSCALPANWQPGQKVIVPPPKTLQELEERVKANYEKVDFYLAKREL
ncbi:MAG: peroxiredoxin [Bacteroidia bacterium]|nr:peroxiredoxin [Bacteroidia bacterium]MDW8158125.1 peroxiredoxin [Bacteroidia bacterium]